MSHIWQITVDCSKNSFQDVQSQRPASDFIAQWKRDRDHDESVRQTWDRPYDQELMAALHTQEISSEQFTQEWQKLWCISPDDAAIRNILDRIFTTCDVLNEDNDREAYELSSEQFEAEIHSLAAELRLQTAANKAVNPSGGSGGS